MGPTLNLQQGFKARLLALVATALLLLCLAGCGDSSSTNNSGGNNANPGGTNTGGANTGGTNGGSAGNSGGATGSGTTGGTTGGTGATGGSGTTGGSGGSGSGGTGGSASTASFVYFASHFDTNIVNAFKVDNSTGALTAVGTAHPSASANWLSGLVGSLHTPYMHLLSYVPVGSSGSDAIDTLTVDTSTGAISPGGTVSPAGSLNATVNASGSLLFAVSNTATGGVLVTYSISTSGALTKIDSDEFGAHPYDIVLNAAEDRLYVSGFSSNNGPSHLVEFSLTGSGVVQQLHDFTEAPYSDLAILGSTLFAVDTGSDHKIHAFRVGSGALTPLAVTSPVVDQPAIAIDPSGKYLVAAGSRSAVVFSIGDGGVLTQVGSMYDIGGGGAPALFASVGGSTYVYLSRFDKVYAYKLDSAGTLTAVSGSPFAAPGGGGEGVLKQF